MPGSIAPSAWTPPPVRLPPTLPPFPAPAATPHARARRTHPPPPLTINNDDDRCCPAFAGDDDGAESATSIEDLPTDVLSLVLRRLDGASMAALGCASAAFRDLAADPAAWRALCLALWPSLRDVPLAATTGGSSPTRSRSPPCRWKHCHSQQRPPAPPRSAKPAASRRCRRVSAVDLRHGGACVMSRAVETDASSAWFLGAPFRVDALTQEGFTLPSPAPIDPADLELSWVWVRPSHLVLALEIFFF
ncbi:hypothetical protein SORBI_3002G213701 [Sorghum bicolor]|uniref:F-box domain-containing protein n=1 Tax=Sorghum bicolor TaxID=4558 RepID=A0A1W0W5E2_SORBI|nr:hypothetical protein SORBI_3002G213701 [Sorghum bicolor]